VLNLSSATIREKPQFGACTFGQISKRVSQGSICVYSKAILSKALNGFTGFAEPSLHIFKCFFIELSLQKACCSEQIQILQVTWNPQEWRTGATGDKGKERQN
jgi:hypothetical protein